MPAYVFTYWNLDIDEEPENYRDTFSPEDGYFERTGVNAPTMRDAVEMFETAHPWSITLIRSIEYIGPGVKNNSSFFDVDNANRNLGYFAKALPRETELA